MHRRQFLSTAPATGLAAATGLVAGTAPARAQEAPWAPPGAQVPAVQRFTVGDITVTAICDGSLVIGHDALIGIEKDAFDSLMTDAFQDPAAFPAAVNTFAIQSGDETIMIDAGTANAMGPSLGQMAANLAAAGIAPDSVTRLIATHLHPDHVAGALTGDGGAFFRNAELAVSETERAFWTDEANFTGAPEMMQTFAQLARNVLSAYGDRVAPFSGEAELGRGLTAMPLPGHTPGHSGIMLSSGDASLLIWADIVHVTPVQFARPDVAIGFDVDPEQAVATRRQILDRVTADRLMVAGSHIGFPGMAHVVADGEGYRMVPAGWQYTL
ncbi:MBL fold metallo-hydrolase [Roseivivax isoporae]|uniref:Lactamase n=1 Tax=Roseivivax isoporae LMG 25204 TaxID=1449351 RepID=X7F8M8_9RHOB|nr:MBL fold metallo-hydrolase [Roseivivax isoporae]ETX28446.1 lactamase [Roseivivax isoporae LMG 25204]